MITDKSKSGLDGTNADFFVREKSKTNTTTIIGLPTSGCIVKNTEMGHPLCSNQVTVYVWVGEIGWSRCIGCVYVCYSECVRVGGCR